MSNSKLIIFFFAITLMIYSGCKISTVAFKDDKINAAFFKNVPTLWDNSIIGGIDSITVYKAELMEELVDRDGIPEFKLINIDSKQPRAGIVGNKNYHELYLCQIHAKDTRLCIFLASSFNFKGECTKLGPAYMGIIRMEQINIKKELKIKEVKKDSSYLISDALKSSLLFSADKDIGVAAATICDPDDIDISNDPICFIRIKEIINSNTNKIGGKKPVIYSTKKIFGDPDALVFKYLKTIIP